MSVHAIAVGYQNTLPLREGLRSLEESGALTIALDRPSRATTRFGAGEFELGLLPAAAQLSVPESLLVGAHGIVADGFVGSVGIFSERPLDELDEILLDYDSRSSVLLARILLKHHWKLTPEIRQAQPGYRQELRRATGGVIIGDPAIEARAHFPFYYDLAAAWREMTGLPFVFARWLSRTPLSANFIAAFDAAQAEGVARRFELALEHQAAVPNYDLARYFTRQIHYVIDERAEEGLALFLRLGRELLGEEAVREPVSAVVARG